MDSRFSCAFVIGLTTRLLAILAVAPLEPVFPARSCEPQARCMNRVCDFLGGTSAAKQQ